VDKEKKVFRKQGKPKWPGKRNLERKPPDEKPFRHDKKNVIEKGKQPAAEEYKLNRGLVQVYTGDGKGKSCTVIGLAVRAAGANLKTGFFQFFKKPFSCEIKVLREMKNIHFYSFASYYYDSEYITGDEIRKLQEDFRRIWEKTLAIISRNNYDVVILDEILIAVRDKLVAEKQILDLIEGRNRNSEIILSGRYLTEKLSAAADIITELKKVKHPFPEIRARKGIDF